MLIKNITQNPQKAYLKCLNRPAILNPHHKYEYDYWASGEVYKDKDGDFIFNLSVKDSIFLGVERKFILTIYEDNEQYVKVITEEQYKNKDYCFTC